MNVNTLSFFIKCSAGSIKVVSNAKYLTIVIDVKLKFLNHIKRIEKKLRFIGVLSKLR